VLIQYDNAFFADPHPTYTRLREQAPAVHVQDPNGLDYWLVTRYREARAALAATTLSKDPRHAWPRMRSAGLVSGNAEDATISMFTADPPEHTRLRAPVAKAFSPARMQQLRPRIEDLADELSDLRGTVDLMDAYAFPLAVTVLCDLLGVPVEDRDDFRTWTTAAHTPTYVKTAPMSRQEGARRLRSYVRELIAYADGLIGSLVADGSLTDNEVVETVSHLLLAGQDATTNLIGNSLAALLRHPDQLKLLRDNPDLAGSAVEELMRYDGPTARSSPRIATHDLTTDTVTIPAGGIVVVGIAAANRDPARFVNPDQVDVTRTDNPHLALGHGSHFCVAAPLARIVGQVALTTLVRRFPDMVLVGDLQWRPTPVFRGLTGLPVQL
jgi:cytochrome P450